MTAIDASLGPEGGFWLDGIPRETEEVRLEVTVPASHVEPQVLSIQKDTDSAEARHLAGLLPVLRAAEDLRIPLAPAGSVRGSVQAPQVDKVEGACIVALWEPQSAFEAGLVLLDGNRISPSREFRLEGLPQGRQVRVGIAGLEGQGLLGIPVAVRTGDTDVELAARPGAQIAGKLTRPEDEAHDGARVRAVSAEAGPAGRPREATVEPGGGGVFAIRGLVPGDYYLVVRSGDDTILAVYGPVAAGTSDVDVRCGAPALLQGRVVDQGVATEAEVEAWARDSGVFLGAAGTTLSGEFALPVPEGTACTVVARRGSSAAVMPEARPGAGTILLELGRTSDLRAELDGFPGLVYVDVSRAGYREGLWVRPQAGVRLPMMPSGRYRVRAFSWSEFYTRWFFGEGIAPAVDVPVVVSSASN